MVAGVTPFSLWKIRYGSAIGYYSLLMLRLFGIFKYVR